MNNVTVIYKGVEIELDGFYTQGEERTYYYPGSGSTYEIEMAYINGVEVIELFNFDQITDLENLAIEQIEE